MFGKERMIKRKTFFLLMMDCSNHPWDIPENTLWLNFEDALEAATMAVTKADETNTWVEFELDEKRHTAFLPCCFEIMPISISTLDRITWLGKEIKIKENVI